ncbi:MAG: hypothetical protein IID46_07515 [Planctomycetes bacterium]|nr:hypothetical protein [Planctomycetota bacterium]
MNRLQKGISSAPVEWTSEHADSDYEPVPPESFVMTAGEVAVELTAEVQYRISNLRQYLVGSSRPEETLRAVAECSIRETAAVTALENILAVQRERFEQQCLSRIQTRIEGYKMGIEVVDLCLLDIHPPQAVVPAYRDVADALEEKERSINEAKTYYAEKVLNAAGEQAIRFLNSSTGAAGLLNSQKSTLSGVSDWTLTEDLWRELTRTTTQGDAVRYEHLSGVAAGLLNKARQESVKRIESSKGAASRFKSLQKRYANQKQLTGRELYWRAVAEALSARPLTIVDPNAAAKQHILLVDPFELGSMPAIQSAFPRDDQFDDPFPQTQRPFQEEP